MLAATATAAAGCSVMAEDIPTEMAPSSLPDEADLLSLDLPPAPALETWFREFTVRTAAGYKDNVSLSAVAPVDSAFLSSGIEAVFSRLPVDEKPQLDFFFIFDDIRYLTPNPVEKEQLAFGHAQIKKSLPGGWEASLLVEYLYQDQVVDISVTETNLGTIQVQGHTFIARPGVKLNLNANLSCGLEFPISRQYFGEPLDDYWEIGPKLNFGVAYGNKSEVSLSYESLNRNYDTDEQLDRLGDPVPGSDRAAQQQEVKLQWRHHWDPKRHWRTTARLGYRLNDDNGAGYFDFQKPFASGQLLYRAKTWEIRAEARYSYYDYKVQTTSTSDSTTRKRQETILTLRAEKELARFLKVFAEYEHERTTANDALDEYQVNIVTTGLNWIF